MSAYFIKALSVCTVSLLLIMGYEALHPYVPAFQSFETSHFWTPYSQKADTTLKAADSTEFMEDLQHFEQDSIASDSLNPEIALTDSTFAALPRVSIKDSVAVSELDNYNGIEHLDAFLKKLQELRQGSRKRVRVAYYGDSTTESDLIVADLRNMMQKIFGGRGVGFVSVAPLGARGRRSIIHKHSANWSVTSYFRQFKNPTFAFGISGDYASAAGESMNRSHTLNFQSSAGLGKVFLYYGKGNSELKPDVFIKSNAGDSLLLELNADDIVNRAQLNIGNAQSIDLAFNFPAAFPVYGLSFESETGIIIDNLAKRSDSGSHFGRISKDVLRSFNELLGGYDLIILHFGANVLSDNVLNYAHYEQILVSTVRHFKESMGDIPVLIVGTSDRVSKSEGNMSTSPAVYALLNAQKRAAARTDSPFLDLFTEMGGAGSMIRWANSNPPKAAPDFVHFSGSGAKEISKIVFDYIAGAYENITAEQIKTPKPGLMKKAKDEHNKSGSVQ